MSSCADRSWTLKAWTHNCRDARLDRAEVPAQTSATVPAVGDAMTVGSGRRWHREARRRVHGRKANIGPTAHLAHLRTGSSSPLNEQVLELREPAEHVGQAVQSVPHLVMTHREIGTVLR